MPKPRKSFCPNSSVSWTYGDNEVIIAKRKQYHDRFELNERDAILITYADTLNREEKSR